MEIAVVAGFAAFLGKYLEQQFNLTTSSANQLLAPTLTLDPYSPCNNNCECQTDSFTPVCGADGITYLSACFAGCRSTNLTGCSCLSLVPAENATVMHGKCPSPGCQEAFLTFLCVMCVCSMIGAMAQTPSVIILIRTVSPELKSYALGVLFLLLRLLGFIPPPLIFGAGIDSTCLFWSTFCGEQGACVLYDNVVYRYLYVSIAIALKSFAFILYTTTWQCLRKNYKRYIKNHEELLRHNYGTQWCEQSTALSDVSYTDLSTTVDSACRRESFSHQHSYCLSQRSIIYIDKRALSHRHPASSLKRYSGTAAAVQE
ncbi:Solute carrier organic anion transporter family member 3A1 [Chelonia mydas]|uniref:Solute carrier organic anion transporter family member 3A1 n=1 Tax=Chelonia mydas TaxID=8469 RepID=M7BDJ6_CHEMY|nr:Solute carrier organic anion transporter family member 3A1 [Chelonia mydas]